MSTKKSKSKSKTKKNVSSLEIKDPPSDPPILKEKPEVSERPSVN